MPAQRGKRTVNPCSIQFKAYPTNVYLQFQITTIYYTGPHANVAYTTTAKLLWAYARAHVRDSSVQQPQHQMINAHLLLLRGAQIPIAVCLLCICTVKRQRQNLHSRLANRQKNSIYYDRKSRKVKQCMETIGNLSRYSSIPTDTYA